MEQLGRLWTPWRAAYVTQSPEESDATGGKAECFLCLNPGLNKDEETLILHRGEKSYLLLNLYPYNSGHLMVAPYAHGGDLLSLSQEAGQEMLSLVRRAVGALTEKYHPSGFNIGMNLGHSAGAGLPDHLHIHVVPRWEGDTNFMPIVSDTKVMPEALQQTYARLAPYFSA